MIDDWETNTTKATKIKPDALKTIQNISKNKNYLASLETYEKKINSDVGDNFDDDNNHCRCYDDKSNARAVCSPTQFDASNLDQYFSSDASRCSNFYELYKSNLDASILISNQHTHEDFVCGLNVDLKSRLTIWIEGSKFKVLFNKKVGSNDENSPSIHRHSTFLAVVRFPDCALSIFFTSTSGALCTRRLSGPTGKNYWGKASKNRQVCCRCRQQTWGRGNTRS
jgi:hypothetical protein